MDEAQDAVTEAIGAWRGRGVPERASTFAQEVVTAARPRGPARARTLLWACSRLAAWAMSVGLEPVPHTCLHPSVIERFAVWAQTGAPPSRRRAVRTHLRFVATRALPEVAQRPWPAPLPRDRAKAPYTEAEVAAFFALARAQATEGRRQRLTALLCLGLGAGLDGADLRHVTGNHVVERSGGLVVVVEGARARVAPVLSEYHDLLREAAAFAGDRYICGGDSPRRRNVTAALTGRLTGGTDLPRLEVGRLRATWLRHHIDRLGLPALFVAAGIVCSQRLGDLLPYAAALREGELVATLGAASR